MRFFNEDKRSALEAIEIGQWIAFAPIIFQATISLRDLGILAVVEAHKSEGVLLEDIVSQTGLSMYGTRVLVEAGLGIGLLYKQEQRYFLSKTGSVILNNKMTRVNMDFTQDICYKGMYELKASIEEGKPKGLKEFGSWNTIYEALAHLPEKAQTSWFNFDHYYSDGSFPQALKHVFLRQPKHLMDIGGNTGKFTLQCLAHNPEVEVTILDLPGQLNMAKANVNNAGYEGRVKYHPINILDASEQFPKGADAIWMSQFLDCFSEAEIVSILKRCYEAVSPDGRIYILETFWDQQRFENAAFSLQMTSLYFTNIANGNSQMYDSAVFNRLLDQAGLVVEEEIRSIGISHTLQICKKKS